MSKSYGPCVGAQQAVAFLEQLQTQLPDGGVGSDGSFWLTYERVLNRVRYMSEPIAPKETDALTKKYKKFYNCGNCGGGLRPELDQYCPKCGRQVKWSAVFAERWP